MGREAIKNALLPMRLGKKKTSSTFVPQKTGKPNKG